MVARTHSLLILIAYIVVGFFMHGCSSYEDPAPLDIITGKVDIQQEYYKSIFKNPVLISGTIKDNKNTDLLANAKITARLENSTTKYTTLSKDDGSFNLYVEGNYTYIFYAEKEGYEKTYFFK